MEKPGLLLITQSAHELHLIKKNLEDEYLIRTTDNAEEAFLILRYLQPELIILDEKTPQFDDKAFCETCRSKQIGCPILIITTNLKKSYTRQMLQLGASDFLREPFDEEELLTRIAIAKQTGKIQTKISYLSQQIAPPNTPTSEFKNRVIVNEKLVNAVSEAQHSKDELSLLIAELDKKDPKYIYPFEQDLTKLLRPQDLLSQISEGKYVIILPKTSKNAATLIAEEIQTALKIAPYIARIGVTELCDTEDQGISPIQSLDLMLNLASHCLLEAQLQGNLIVSHFKGLQG
ncbi:MAG: response regulator [Simkaniaceae bacterium]|nr:response regulator [Simkaniaceae bacterium]